MVLDLRNVFLEEGASLPFDYEMDLSSTDIDGAKPFVSPVSIKGIVRNSEGSARLEAEAGFDFSIPCDRCAEQIDRHYSYRFEHLLVLSLNEEDNDSYIEVQDYQLDLDELIRADILLELPTKFLCSPDCKGLCPKCGRNLNEGPCGCITHQMDPRLEVLKKLID